MRLGGCSLLAATPSEAKMACVSTWNAQAQHKREDMSCCTKTEGHPKCWPASATPKGAHRNYECGRGPPGCKPPLGTCVLCQAERACIPPPTATWLAATKNALRAITGLVGAHKRCANRHNWECQATPTQSQQPKPARLSAAPNELDRHTYGGDAPQHPVHCATGRLQPWHKTASAKQDN